ncbi:ribonuclease H-like domain-containing protein [Tanacetum coccineum]
MENELKAKSTLILAIPDEHLLKFHACKDAKSLWEAIKNRIGGNKESKKIAPQLENEDLEQIDADDLKEMDLKWQVAMLTMRVKRFIKKTRRKLDLNDKEIVGFDRTKVECYNCHRRGYFARECRAPRNQGNRNRDAPSRNALVDTSTTNALVVQDGIGGYDWSFQAEEGPTNFALMAYTSQGSSSSDSEVHTCSKDCLKSYEALQKQYDQQREALNKSNLEIIGYQMGLESLEARIVVHEKNEAVYEEDIAFLKYDVQVKDISIKELKNYQISAKDKTGLGYDSHVNQGEVLDNVFDSVFDSHESDGDDNQVIDRFKKVEGYHAVSPPYTGNFMPPRADLSFVGLDDSIFRSTVSETITSVPSIETNASKSSKDSLQEPKTVRSSAPLIEEWESDSEDENVFKPKEVNKTVKPSFEKIEFVNDKNTTVQKPRNFSQSPGSNKRNWNGLMTQRLGDSFDIKKKLVFSQRAAVSVSAARRVNTTATRPNVNDALPTTYSYFKAHSPVRRPFNQKLAAKTNNFNKKVNTAKVKNVTTVGPKAVVSAAEENRDNVVKSSACWIWRPKGNLIEHISKDSGSYTPKRFNYVDPQGRLNGCSRHMTGNKSYLTDYQEIDCGFVAFGGSAKGGKITGKGKIKTGKLDFEDVYFVKELKFNLFSVSQMCDKKNSVLFTDTECVILSPDFKLLDERGLTCLFAKATLDESNLWHRRLGHINFKTMNKLVRGNLVRGLLSKLFENDHSCVACQKGKQHKASFSVRSINKKNYCLVVTDDFSIFSWVFFLATKDVTPEILNNFITGIENQIDNKVKTIRCDNRTEFKNKIMNEFFEMKGRKPALNFMKPFGCPVTILNTLDHLGTKANIDVGQAGKKTVPGP